MLWSLQAQIEGLTGLFRVDGDYSLDEEHMHASMTENGDCTSCGSCLV